MLPSTMVPDVTTLLNSLRTISLPAVLGLGWAFEDLEPGRLPLFLISAPKAVSH